MRDSVIAQDRYFLSLRSFYHATINHDTIYSLKIGSFEETLSFFILPALANPDIRAVLQGLVTNIVWILGTGIGNVIKGSLPKPKQAVVNIDIGQNITNVLMAYSERSGEPVKLEIKQQTSSGATTTIALEVGPRNISNLPPLPIHLDSTPSRLLSGLQDE